MGRGKRKKRANGQHCALCGKKMLFADSGCIVGATGRIVCSNCLQISQHLLESAEENVTPTVNTTPTPQAIMAELDKAIIGQHQAKQAVAIALWKQLLRANGDEDIPRTNLLLYGPSGCSKTALVQEAARIVDIPFISFDATTLSEIGYRGSDARDMVVQMCKRFEGHPKQAYGIIFVDEVDKLAAKGSDSRTAYNRGTQHSLLKLIEGTEVDVDKETIHTDSLLFIFGGAFTDLKKKEEDEKPICRPVGFLREVEETPVQEESGVTMEDFVLFGMETELMGRIGQRIALEPLGAEDLKNILLNSRLSLYRRYQQFFRQHGVPWAFTDEELDRLVQQAIDFGTGARALNALVEEAVEPMLLRFAAGEWQEVRHAG